MRYVVIALLALILGGLVGRMIWGEKKPEPVDRVQVILTQVRTHAVIEHERQVAIWYRACPQVLGKTPTIFIAWPAKLVYQLELADVQIKRTGGVIKVTTQPVHSDEPSVPSDFVDYLSTTSLFTFANEQELVNREIGKASPSARYLTSYFLYHDASIQSDFADELRSLVEHMAGALGVPFTRVDVDIPVVKPERPEDWPKVPKLELCEGTLASVNGLPFAKVDSGTTLPIGFRPPPAHSRSLTGARPTAPAPATSTSSTAPGTSEAPKGNATFVPAH